MKKAKLEEIDKDMIPIQSVEAEIVINKLFDEAISLFAKNQVNMPLGIRKN